MNLLFYKVRPTTISRVNFTAPSKRRKLQYIKDNRREESCPTDFTPCIPRQKLLNAIYAVNPSAAILTVVPASDYQPCDLSQGSAVNSDAEQQCSWE